MRLWLSCRGGMGGYSAWPDAGGVGDQAGWVVDAFSALTSLNADMDAADQRLKGAG